MLASIYSWWCGNGDNSVTFSDSVPVFDGPLAGVFAQMHADRRFATLRSRAETGCVEPALVIAQLKAMLHRFEQIPRSTPDTRWQRVALVNRLFDLLLRERDWIVEHQPGLASVVKEKLRHFIDEDGLTHLRFTFRAMFVAPDGSDDPWTTSRAV